MRTLSVSQLKATLSEELQHVQAGEELVVTDRGRPIARLVPHEDRRDGQLSALVRAGLVRQGPGLCPDFWTMPRPADPAGSVRAALADEREDGW
jgi:prevent-host-death family protein